MADERTAKAVELEQKVALLEFDSRTARYTEARAHRGQKKSPEDANQVIQRPGRVRDYGDARNEGGRRRHGLTIVGEEVSSERSGRGGVLSLPPLPRLSIPVDAFHLHS
ncbi:hypothetical protein L2E82_34404 [Cichorium intybus]|uniref:Uncharacterized protein n=1 Tax=Cichorium intybus TaxID=13427 RepID=A0ACB9BM16_CICIN|nr:hypothetical protein L2E82_34404 [Cichorium intybus]